MDMQVAVSDGSKRKSHTIADMENDGPMVKSIDHPIILFSSSKLQTVGPFP